ncbi:MAG: AAA family ATPase [Terriglobales bacterium]
MLTTIAIANYRSLRNVVVPLANLNVVTGANGTGKSNLYRALRLLADVAQGRVVSSIAREGGLNSTLWAGPETIARSVRRAEFPVQGTPRKKEVSLRMGFASDEYGFAIDLGLPKPGESAFGNDPHIKREVIWHGAQMRPSTLLVDRRYNVVRVNGDTGWNVVTDSLSPFDSMMTHLSDPKNAPEVLMLRELIRRWRFYDHFRTDAHSPVRIPQIGTWTPVMSDDGSDVASAIQTIFELDNEQAFQTAVEDAFPGSRVRIATRDGRFAVEMTQHGLLRPLSAAELSDGTLRYLLWIAALLTPRPPALMVMNEPETSLHPDLLPALGRLIANAAKRTQVIVVTHAAKLVSALQEQPDCQPIVLAKDFGETTIVGSNQFNTPKWQWPAR